MSPIRKHLLHNLLIVTVSVGVAIVLKNLGVFEYVLSYASQFPFVGIFIAGIFYTSVFTVGPAAVVLGGLMMNNSVWLVALIGAIGSAFGDLAIFRFLRAEIGQELKALPVFRFPFAKYIVPVLGFMIIGSPLPDELGLALLGTSTIKPRLFFLLAYVADFIGIALLGLAVRSLL